MARLKRKNTVTAESPPDNAKRPDPPDYFRPSFSEDRLAEISSRGLAHIGDAVYELLVRSWLCSRGALTNRVMHSACIRRVSAGAQAEAAKAIAGQLTPEELEVFRRGRNAHTGSVPRNTDIASYHAATGLETLFGWLWLKGEPERANELFYFITEEKANAD